MVEFHLASILNQHLPYTARFHCFSTLVITYLYKIAVWIAFLFNHLANMGIKNDLSPRKKGQIRVLLEETSLKQAEIAKKLGVSTATITQIKKKMQKGEDLKYKRVGNCGRKRSTTPRIDRRMVVMALKDRRASCKKISSVLASEGFKIHRRTVNRRLLGAGLKAYRPRKKPRLTEKMKKERLAWANEHKGWTADDWSKVIYLNSQ